MHQRERKSNSQYRIPVGAHNIISRRTRCVTEKYKGILQCDRLEAKSLPTRKSCGEHVSNIHHLLGSGASEWLFLVI